MTILNYIQQLLEENEQPATFMKASADFPYDRILVDSGKNLLEITTHPQSFEGMLNPDKISGSYHLIYFQYVIPSTVSPDTFNQVSSALHFFNRLIHCPGFELDELNDQILYRYSWFVKKEGLDSFLLMQVLGNIRLCLEIFSPYIQGISEGKYTLEEILIEVTQLSDLKLHHLFKSLKK